MVLILLILKIIFLIIAVGCATWLVGYIKRLSVKIKSKNQILTEQKQKVSFKLHDIYSKIKSLNTKMDEKSEIDNSQILDLIISVLGIVLFFKYKSGRKKNKK